MQKQLNSDVIINHLRKLCQKAVVVHYYYLKKKIPSDFNCDKACIPPPHNNSFLDSPQPCFIQIYLHPL